MEKNLTTEQSLDLIARMIATTRRNFNDRGGAMFLIWGYTTVVVTIAIVLTVQFVHSPAIMWGWMALPLIGTALTWRHFSRHSRPVYTHLDKAVWSVWIVGAIAAALCMVSVYVAAAFDRGRYIDILFTMALMIILCIAVTGRLIGSRPVKIGGLAGIALAFVLPALANTGWQMPAFAALFLVAQVIPGHLLNAECRREMQEAGGLGTANDGRAPR